MPRFGASRAIQRSKRGGGAAVPAVPTATFTMAQLGDAKRIYQRSTTTGGAQSKGQGTVPVTISSATAGTINARIRSSDTTTILQAEWAAATVSGGATTANIAGVDARLGWFYLDLKDSTGAWQNGSTLIGMGALFGFAGQSLMVRMFGRQDGQTATYATLAITPDANSSVLMTYNETNAYMPTVATMPWQAPGDVGNGLGPNSVGIGEFLNRMIAMIGVNCGGIGHAQGGVSISTYITGQTNWTQLASVLARAGGAFEGFHWGQGHSDAVYGIPGKAYADALTLVFNQITAANTYAGYKKYLWSVPTISSTNWGTPYERNLVRKAAEDWCSTVGATYVHMLDFAQVDGVHQSQTGAITMARHMYRATRADYGQTSGLGPQVISATRSGTAITVALSDVGQTSIVLAGTPGNRVFAVSKGRYNNAGSVNDNRFPVSSVTVTNKTTLSVVLANDPGDGHDLDLYFGWPAGPADATLDNIYDNRTDGDGITTGRPLRANHATVAVAAPVAASTINAPPGGFVAATSPFNMVETSTAYATGATGFGQELTGGTLQLSSAKAPNFLPRTIECMFVCPTPLPASLFALVGTIGTDYLGITPGGKLSTNQGTGATTLVPGKRYHAAYTSGPTGARIYLTNITDGTSGVRDLNTVTPTSVRPAAARWDMRCPNGSLDEAAIWYGEKYTGASYTAPAGPYVGTEADLVALYHFEGNAKDVIAA